MALSTGSRLGAYEITGRLGAGGMGEVYRARDTKLNREVAIKVLPDLFAADAERLARFTREAQTLAALNHPNIAAIYGIEESRVQGPESSIQGIVMELVEGEDLSALIGSSVGLPLSDALAIARQIIDALEAAHDLGIVHRDLKPANIKVRHDGTVKVLDFGLARTLDSGPGTQDTSNSPTLTARATQMGMIIGTAAYMSPEQARGRPVDKRTDVWAFGCVLYEMLSGAKAFDGEDATEIISSVVKSEPNWGALPDSVPAHIRTIVTRCLVKDRKARIPDLSVVRYMLDGTVAAASASVAAVQAPSRGSARVWQIATAVMLLAAVAAGSAWYRGRAVEPAVSRFVIPPPDGLVFTGGARPGSTVPVISPDGRMVAFTAQRLGSQRLLYVRPVDSLVAQPLPGTEGASFPFWSPDSRSIGYSVLGKMMKVAATGGPSQTLCPLNSGITSRGGSWSAEGVIIFNNGPAAPLHRVPAAGATACVAMGTLPEGQTGRQFPVFLPDGRHFLFHASGSEETGGVFVGSLDSDEATRVLSSDTGAIYDQHSGHLLFVRQGTLLAQLFDAKTFALSGDPFPIAEKVEAAVVPGLIAFSLSETGTLAYGNGQAADGGLVLTWVDRQGKATGTVGPPRLYRGVSLSPDGLQVAAHPHEGEGGDIWLTDVAQNLQSRFTLDAGAENQSPAWSPGSDRLAFGSVRNGKPGIYVRAANRTGVDERVFETTTSRSVMPLSWSSDGKAILFQVFEAKTGRDLWMVSLEGDRKAWPLMQSEAHEQWGQLSPDGRWLAYGSNETGTNELYVKPAAANGGQWPISNGGGGSPRWRGDSRELFYVSRGKMQAVEVTAKGEVLVLGARKELFESLGFPPHSGDAYFPWAVTKDGQRFLMPRRFSESESEIATNPIVIVLNWLSGIT